MKVRRTGPIAAAILALAMGAWTQKPDFSGTWTLDPSSVSDGGGGTEGSSALGNGPSRIEQTAETLTIRRTGTGAATLTYRLDGTGSRNVVAGANGGEIDSLSIVTWDGPRLTIVTKREAEGKLVEAREVWTVAGNTLTVETGREGGTQKKRIYKKR
jgi:hypothetical protein